MIWILAGLALGVVVGFYIPFTYPANYSCCCGSEKKSDILVGGNKYQCLCSSCYFKKKNLGPKIGWSEVEQDNIYIC